MKIQHIQRPIRRTGAIVAVTALGLLAACNTDKMAEDRVNAVLEDAGLDGNLQLDGDLPEGFPGDVLVPGDSVDRSVTLGNPEAIAVYVNKSGDVDTLAAEALARLESLGWETVPGSAGPSWVLRKGTDQLTFSISKIGGTAELVYALAPGLLAG